MKCGHILIKKSDVNLLQIEVNYNTQSTPHHHHSPQNKVLKGILIGKNTTRAIEDSNNNMYSAKIPLSQNLTATPISDEVLSQNIISGEGAPDKGMSKSIT